MSKFSEREPEFVTERLTPAVNAHAVAYRVNVLAADLDRLSVRLSYLEKHVMHLERLIAGGHKTVIMKLKRKVS